MIKRSVVLRLTVAAVAVLIICSMTACTFPVSMCALPDPAVAVEGFVAAYRAGDGELLAKYTYNYEAVELGGLSDTEYHKKLFSLLRENFALAPAGAAEVSGKDATLRVSATCFDFRLLGTVLSEETTSAALEYSKENQSIEDEVAAMELLCGVIDELTVEPSQYCTSEPLTLALHYDGGWQVCIDDALYSVLIGHVA